MHTIPLLAALATLCAACPMHGTPDYHAADDSTDAANVRKRSFVSPAPQKLAITNVYVFDGHSLSNRTSTVVIDGSFIGSDATNATVIDGQGGTLMPGLIDNHNHASNLGDIRNLTSWGVTTTMCMSCWIASDLCASLRNQPGLSDFYSSGYSAVVPNSSHSKLAETNPAVNAPQYFIYNSSMAPGWVEDRINTGSNYIKLVAEAYPPSMSQEEHNVIVQTAHQHGYWTMTHASTLGGYETAIESGSDFIQHTPADGLLSNDSIARLVAQHSHVTPTANIYQHAQAAKDALQLTDAELANINYTIGTNVMNMYRAGVPILAGTDSSINSNGPANIPFGSALHQELHILSHLGIPNLEVLKAATSRAADAYNMLDRGIIAPGRRADLLLIRGDPIANISKVDDIDRIWVAGIEYQGQIKIEVSP